MLVQLSINNYAIIDKLNIKPDGHLNIVTGETGAGKSIILGAMSLILGERADTSVLINKEQKCVVEACFDISNNAKFKSALLAAELDEEEQCIIRREINSSGKSRAFVNDTPVNLTVLNSLTALLVDLHQQFDNHAIEDDAFQLFVVDVLAQNEEIKKRYIANFDEYQQITQELKSKQAQQLQWQKDVDYKQFLFDELEQFNFAPNEIENTEQQLKQLSASEKIISILQQARFVLDEGEQPLANEVKRQAQQLQSISDLLPDAQSLNERLLSIYAEAKDIASELELLESKISVNPAQMQLLEERLDAGLKLQKKHAVTSTNELIAIYKQLGEELAATLNLHEAISKLEEQHAKLLSKVHHIGKELTESRAKIAPKLSLEITKMLADVGMPNAQFKVTLNLLKQATFSGLDQIVFQLDANKSGNFQPVNKAASGGEMSRIALCIKSLIARAVHLPTLIFDEVDTGISGEAARKVAALLQDLAVYHQVICITHQPQVAAKGSTHFYVYKEAGKDGKINTQVRVLATEEKVFNIAQMIGGEEPSEAALNNARELVG
ncbi:MAG: DNA repair protein RecN [Chitinophagaceae bacterium]|nr:DNA repair protein RecN [Chitinophagaceae bacterium]